MIVAGIDVRAKTVTVVIRRSERSGQPREFKNTPQGQAAVVNALRNASVTHAGLEATGRYRRALALALDNAKLQVLVVNPKVAQRLAEARWCATPSNRDCGMLGKKLSKNQPGSGKFSSDKVSP